MSTQETRIRILAILCDAQGLVQRVLADDWGLSARLQPGHAWTALLDPSSLAGALAFWQALQDRQAVSSWELAVPLGEGVLPLQFSAAAAGEAVTLVAAAPSIDAIRGAQADPAHSLLEEGASHPAAHGPALYAELARLKDELAGLRRELAEKGGGLQERHRLLEHIFAVTPSAIYLLDLEQQVIVQANPALPRLLGLEAGALPGMSGEQWMELIHPQDRLEYAAHLRRRSALAAGEMIEHEHRIVRPNGSVAWLHTREVVFAVDAQGRPAQILGASYDVTRSRQTQERLLQQSLTDSLTGLGNRAFMEAELHRLQAAASGPVSLLVAGLRDLNAVNERPGPAASDEMLRRAGQVLQTALRAGESIARTGDDEFVVILPNTSRSAVLSIIRRIRRSLAYYNTGRYDDLSFSLALGVATAQPGEPLSIALQAAGRRMGQKKARRRRGRKTE